VRTSLNTHFKLATHKHLNLNETKMSQKKKV